MNQTTPIGPWPRMPQRFARRLIGGARIGLLLIWTSELNAEAKQSNLQYAGKIRANFFDVEKRVEQGLREEKEQWNKGCRTESL